MQLADDEEPLVLVNIRITLPSPVKEGFQETVTFQLLDLAPDFEQSSGIIEQYMELDGAILDVEHLDPPEVIACTHEGTGTIQ